MPSISAARVWFPAQASIASTTRRRSASSARSRRRSGSVIDSTGSDVALSRSSRSSGPIRSPRRCARRAHRDQRGADLDERVVEWPRLDVRREPSLGGTPSLRFVGGARARGDDQRAVMALEILDVQPVGLDVDHGVSPRDLRVVEEHVAAGRSSDHDAPRRGDGGRATAMSHVQDTRGTLTHTSSVSSKDVTSSAAPRPSADR